MPKALLSHISAYNSVPVASNVGPNRDSYHLCTWFRQDLNGGPVTVSCTATRNFHYADRREVIAKGSATECLAAIQERIDQAQLATQSQEVAYAQEA